MKFRLLRAAAACVTAILCLVTQTVGATEVHPVLWTVHGKNCTLRLLGSIHLLPPGMAWRDERVEDAIYNSDVFVFEVAENPAAMKQFMTTSGALPSGTSLRAMLPEAAQANLDQDAALVNASVAALDSHRPWFVAAILEGMKNAKLGFSPYSGVDFSIRSEVLARGKPVRYLETFEQQMALVAPTDLKLEIASFEAFLADFRDQDNMLPDLVDAWSVGDVSKLERLGVGSLREHPDARKALLDDRNEVWAKQLEQILDTERGTFLVTVGALHLVGPASVPTLLRAHGYTVDGP